MDMLRKTNTQTTSHLVRQQSFCFWIELNVLSFNFLHKPAQSTDVAKGVEHNEEREADPGEEEHAHTLQHNTTQHSKIELDDSFQCSDVT